MIGTRDVSVRFGDTPILRDISMEVPSGEVSVLIGQNGAGKSTLLQAIAGNTEYHSGTITYDGQNLDSIENNDLARMRSVVMQDTTLSFSFDVRDVVLMGRIPHSGGFESKQDYEIVDRCLRTMELGPFEERSFTTLSGGEKQRVHLARAMAQIWDRRNTEYPCYLLLDEPASSLDIQYQHQLLSMLRTLAGQGITVLVVLHQLNLAARYGDRITVLKEGGLFEHGPVEEVFTEETISEAFDCESRIIHDPEHSSPIVLPEKETAIPM
jgi:iron complex transport system ATP-binding protein